MALADGTVCACVTCVTCVTKGAADTTKKVGYTARSAFFSFNTPENYSCNHALHIHAFKQPTHPMCMFLFLFLFSNRLVEYLDVLDKGFVLSANEVAAISTAGNTAQQRL